jgi:hypothetical protein
MVEREQWRKVAMAVVRVAVAMGVVVVTAVAMEV